MAYNNTQVAPRQTMDVSNVTGAETIAPEIIALTQAFLTASPEITLPQAVKAAYFFHNTGQVEGRDSYIGTTGRVTGKVLEGYRGVARDAAERGVGEVQIKYRPLTADEAEWHEVKPGDLARACEVYQLRAWRIAQRMGQPYEPIIGIGIIKPNEKKDKDGNMIPLIGGMTWGKKCQNRAYKDAMRHVPGMAITAAEVLEDAEERDIHVEVPSAAQLTREQAIALVAEAERLSIAPPQPMNAEQAAATLAQNNAKTRGTGPDWQGFGDDDERQGNDAAFEQLPSASAERATNGKAPAATSFDRRAHDPNAPWDDTRKEEAVAWAMRRYPEIFEAKPHARKSLDKLIRELGQDGTVNTPPDTIARAWKDKCAAKQDELDAKKLQALLDAQAAGEEMPVFESR